MRDTDYSFSNYLKYSWNYANNYMNYENELIKFNNIKDDKIIEYTNKFILEISNIKELEFIIDKLKCSFNFLFTNERFMSEKSNPKL